MALLPQSSTCRLSRYRIIIYNSSTIVMFYKRISLWQSFVIWAQLRPILQSSPPAQPTCHTVRQRSVAGSSSSRFIQFRAGSVRLSSAPEAESVQLRTELLRVLLRRSCYSWVRRGHQLWMLTSPPRGNPVLDLRATSHTHFKHSHIAHMHLPLE